ncbi:MAG: histone deacetylase [Gemmatimonadales bacterium]|nr:histone deacetylase [Gemmatimonadales bacterium]
MALPPVFTHDACLAHNPGPGHPESPRRLEVLLERLGREPGAEVRQAGPADVESIVRVHPGHYLDFLTATSARGGGMLDADTILNERSWEAALGAAGAALDATRYAVNGGGHAFAAVRPPGHHALRERAMGFCLLGNVVVAAREARTLGKERVLIVDWDVHHGNGTQALVELDPAIRFVSMHEWPAYPGTGLARERGVGNIFNVPMPAGLPRSEYVEALLTAVARATEEWTPDIVLISAGYDSLAGDPLGGFTLEPVDYTTLVRAFRDRFPSVPIVGLLEGGYAPGRVADGVVATLLGLA